MKSVILIALLVVGCYSQASPYNTYGSWYPDFSSTAWSWLNNQASSCCQPTWFQVTNGASGTSYITWFFNSGNSNCGGVVSPQQAVLSVGSSGVPTNTNLQTVQSWGSTSQYSFSTSPLLGTPSLSSYSLYGLQNISNWGPYNSSMEFVLWQQLTSGTTCTQTFSFGNGMVPSTNNTFAVTFYPDTSTGWFWMASNEYSCCYPTSISVTSGSNSSNYAVSLNYNQTNDPWCNGQAASVTYNGNIQLAYTSNVKGYNASVYSFSTWNLSNATIAFAQNLTGGANGSSNMGQVELVYNLMSQTQGWCTQVYKSATTLFAGVVSFVAMIFAML